VQLRLPWDVPAPHSSLGREHRITVAGVPVAVHIVRHRRARRCILRVEADGGVRLTVPRRASVAAGLRFAAGQAEWIARERRRRSEQARPWTDGTLVLVRGEAVPLRLAGRTIRCGNHDITLEGDDVRRAVQMHWRAVAEAELPARCHELAEGFGFAVHRVAVRNQRSRWGACSPRGIITLNWRLIQMPPVVSDYVILHELTHLHQPNHSVRFWRAVERVCPAWRDAERWLRQNGRHLL